MKRLTIELDAELFKQIKIVCAERNITIKDFITELIEKAIKQ